MIIYQNDMGDITNRSPVKMARLYPVLVYSLNL